MNVPIRNAPTGDVDEIIIDPATRADVQAQIEAMRDILEELRDYFVDKADVLDGGHGQIPDINMRWEICIRQALGEQI